GPSQGSSCSPDSDDGGLPLMSAGSAPAVESFRGLLGVHASSGLPARGVAGATLSIGGFGKIVTSLTAPIATGWSNNCQVGIAPTEERHLSRRTDIVLFSAAPYSASPAAGYTCAHCPLGLPVPWASLGPAWTLGPPWASWALSANLAAAALRSDNGSNGQ